MPIFRRYEFRCPVCLLEFSFKAMANAGVKQCPNKDCRTILQPLETKYDGYVRVNWQDLRTLAIYSLRWSRIFDLSKKGDRDAGKALTNIIDRLMGYQPQGAPPLIPDKDAEKREMRNVEVIGEINTGDNMPIDLRPDSTGNIPSPFFRKRKA